MKPIWEIKPFEVLTVHELYDTLKLRSEVFVVEQNCVYLDIDGKDKLALHLMGEYEGKIVAHARLFDAGISFDNASIGRVVVSSDYRDKKWGHDLMREAFSAIKSSKGSAIPSATKDWIPSTARRATSGPVPPATIVFNLVM